MGSPLHSFLQKNTRLTESDIIEIVSRFTFYKAQSQEMLVQEGKICNRLYFIIKGCLRVYETDKKGNDITAYFALEDSFVTCLTSFITQKPSRDCLIALEPSEIMVIGRDAFSATLHEFPAFKNLYDQFIQFAFIHAQMRIYSFLGMEGIDKLKWVMEHEPKLLTRVPGKAVASYLGMTNSTLSKLKAKI